MRNLVAFTVLVLALNAVRVYSQKPVPLECPPLCPQTCDLGNVLDENGCPTCDCCEEYTCDLDDCEHEKDELGCPYCTCRESVGNSLDSQEKPSNSQKTLWELLTDQTTPAPIEGNMGTTSSENPGGDIYLPVL